MYQELSLLGVLASAVLFMTRIGSVFNNEWELVDQRIVFVIAHPDDEAMFFSPTVTHVTQPDRNNSVSLLCLSNGNAEGLGDIRGQELFTSANTLGIPPTNVSIVDDPRLPDSMKITWEPSVVAEHIEEYVKDLDPTVIITFDEYGISGHTNHRQTFLGAVEYAGKALSLSQKRPTKGSKTLLPYDVSLVTIKTVSIMRKYLFVFDGFIAKIANTQFGHRLIMNSEKRYHLAIEAMRNGHASQMKWFRWLWLGFSRYMLYNDVHTVNLERALEVLAEQSSSAAAAAAARATAGSIADGAREKIADAAQSAMAAASEAIARIKGEL